MTSIKQTSICKMVGKLFHLVAYRQTGKDTLVEELSKFKRHNWQIYSPDGQPLIFPTKNIRRVAYADKLKLEICRHLLFPTDWVQNGTFDKYKDVPANDCPEEIRIGIRAYSDEVDTLRDICRNFADNLKAIHGDMYFVNLVHQDINDLLAQNHNVFITDTRYPFEIFEEGISIRMFRSEVPIPDSHIDSERSLDDYSCQYVMCKNDSDFSNLKENQPQYEKYRRANGTRV